MNTKIPNDFDSNTYLELNPDVRKAGVDPAEHYLKYGIKEGRNYKVLTGYATAYQEYSENNYGKVARITDAEYRRDLQSWQIPAIKKHCGDLNGKFFLDLGAGDIVYGDKLDEIGRPAIFYVQDLSEPSLQSGLNKIKESGEKTDIFVTMSSEDFDFEKIPDGTLDFAFSNSLFSHLTINSIILCLKNLSPKMQIGGKYFSSMIVLHNDDRIKSFDWGYLKTKYSRVVSHPTKDPYHYTANTVFMLSHADTGFHVREIHDYGHPFQKLVEFEKF
jgi:hypothetical protein